jgi:hypothetical protein
MKYKDIARSIEPWKWNPGAIGMGRAITLDHLRSFKMESKPVTLDDIEKAQAGRTMDTIPMNDPYWELCNRFRSQENAMSLDKDTPTQVHEDVDPESLNEVVQEKEDEDEFDEDDPDDDDEDGEDDEPGDVSDQKENSDFAQDNVIEPDLDDQFKM